MNEVLSYRNNIDAHRIIAEKAVELYQSCIYEGERESKLLSINCIKYEFGEYLKSNGMKNTKEIEPMYVLSITIFNELWKERNNLDTIFNHFATQDVARGTRI